ncbi:MAG: tRNA uridine-5-carboxymethylaminomethyl(34) synthesis enzyme MnmG [Bacilli bacterium]|nr:tRNA uridine-5-carboxymethylaminomethyl(34) synthesis enzyme MnmG [Bacilli bacterium]
MSNRQFDVIVVGGGHAGVEASHATAAMGHATLLLTLHKEMIANMPCNPHIGGSAKGVVVREVDALGGIMGIAADMHPLQIKMLNTGKGPGVQCLRSQQDKRGYPAAVLSLLEQTPNLTIEENEVTGLLYEAGKIQGVILANGEQIFAKRVILTTGTYLCAKVISGQTAIDQGPDGEKASLALTPCLQAMGIQLWRLKTGTPPRIARSSIDFSQGRIEEGMEGELCFSFQNHKVYGKEEQLPCYLIYTSEKTLQIIHDHLQESALFNGLIQSTGPRYCPSIESKVVRFSDKPRHQLFLEPEFENGESIYLQGFSTGFSHEIQEEMVHSLPGLEHAKILKYAYQIEYDAVQPEEYDATLRIKKYEGLYVAGQLCGTSGYEEAAGLGLMAGINAALSLEGKPPFILGREEAYIGVMIDDLVTKGTDEPYRLLSSRAEFRLLLRHDNADERLSRHGHEVGLLNDARYQDFLDKQAKIQAAIHVLKTTNVADKAGLNAYFAELGLPSSNEGFKGFDLLKRPGFSYRRLAALMPELEPFHFHEDAVLALETKVKYEGYLKKQELEAESVKKAEEMALPEDLDYLHMDGLRLEARQKLDAVRPRSVGQASRIAGVNPADVSILLLNLKKRKSK